MTAPLPPPSEPEQPPRPPATGRRFERWHLAVISVLAIVIVGGIAFLLTRPSDTTAAPTTTGPAGTTATTSTTDSSTGTTSATGSSSTTITTTTMVDTVSASDPSAEGTWTVLVYGVGDNNLEDALMQDMREMREVTKDTTDLTFVVLADRAEDYSDETLGRLGDWTSTKLVEISGSSFTELDDWGEKNLGEADVLAEFVTASVQAAPADHYAIVFWDHGSMMGIGPDESADDVLEAWEMAVGLESGLRSSGVTLDFIGFDACLMASLEVTSVVAPYATFMIASEELEPNEGWEYSGFAYVGTSEATVVGLGQSILQAYFDASAATDPMITLSMLDLRRYEEFDAALNAFTDVALDTIDTSAVAIGRRRDNSVKFGADPDPLKDWFMVDLGQLLGRLSRSEAPVAAEAGRAATLLDEIVVSSVAGAASDGARGLSVHFPPAPDLHYPAWYEAFGDPVWAGFLDGYFDAGRAIPEENKASVDDTSPNTSFLFDDYGLEITAEIQPGALGTVVSAVLWSGIPEPDGSVTYYSSDQGIVEGMLAVGFYDLTQLWLSDGEDTIIAFQQLSINEDLTIVTMTVPLAYAAPIDPSIGSFDDPIDVTLKVTFNTVTEEFTEELFASSYGTIGSFVPEPDGLFFPLVPYQTPDGAVEWITTSEIGLWSDLPYITYDFIDLPSGTPLYGELIIADFGGNTATVYANTEVP